ncbi:MAG: hypothetical protein KA715_07800 [Xanthomonadaceae bacterium]|nr:hypothetical protein [Xanthomonadaceae bacterium]
MSTFQVIILSLLTSVTEIIPVGAQAHLTLLTQFTGWSMSDTTVASAINWGLFAGMFFAFIHDWLSIVSSTITMILYRKKPMTFDERFPFFLIFIVAPTLFLKTYLPEPGINSLFQSPWTLWIVSFVIGLSFLRIQSQNRRLKTFFVWNLIDSIVVGIAQITSLIPGVGLFSPAVIVGGMKHYHWDAIYKYAALTATPFLLAQALEATQAGGTEWLSINVFLAIVLASVGSYFAAISFKQTIESRNLSNYGWYRIAIGVVGAVVTLFF